MCKCKLLTDLFEVVDEEVRFVSLLKSELRMSIEVAQESHHTINLPELVTKNIYMISNCVFFLPWPAFHVLRYVVVIRFVFNIRQLLPINTTELVLH